MPCKPSCPRAWPPNGAVLEHVARLGLAMLLFVGSGCAWWRPDPYGDTARCHLPADMPELEVVRRVNARSARIRSLKAPNCNVVYRGPEGTHSLNGVMAAEAPRNFSLEVSFVGPEVCLGSNDQQFWFWAKRSDHQKILMARHEDLAIAQRQFPIPFQPDWIMEALGVVPIDETNARIEEVPPDKAVKGRRVWVVTECVSPQGEPVKKVVLVDACHGIPLKHELIDTNGRRIATASLENWREDKLTKEPVPGKIVLDWPAERMSITITLNNVMLNPSFTPQTFTMPELKNYPVVDLGRVAQADGVQPHHGP